MNSLFKRKVIILVFFLCLVCGCGVSKSSDKDMLKELYENPIKVNEEFEDYTYNEYSDHVTILKYDGDEKELNIPKQINGKLVFAIDDSSFYGNENIEKVVVPNSVVRIGYQAFIGCENLKEITLPDGIIEFGESVFDVCPNLEKINVKMDSKTDDILKKSVFKRYINYK